MDGTSGISLVSPKFLTIDTTDLGPTRSINCAVTVLTELARASFSVYILPEYCPTAFFGHQGSGLPCLPASIQYWVSGSSSQGDNRSWSMAAAYTNGLKVEPTWCDP